jgi:hypothetical protein
MVRACRNRDSISVSRQILLLLVLAQLHVPLFDPEKLIGVPVYLVTNVFPRGKAHHYELRVLSGE